MANLIARFFARMHDVLGKLDNSMWHAWVFYPDSFYARLRTYQQETEEIAQIRWERRRFAGDVAIVVLTKPVDSAALDRMARDISQRMNDGNLRISFLYQRQAVAQVQLLNGRLKPEQPASLITDLFDL